MPDKPKGIFKRLDQFNNPHRTPVAQPVQPETNAEVKPSLRPVPTITKEASAGQTPENKDSTQPSVEEGAKSLIESNFEQMAEHPPPQAKEAEGLRNSFPLTQQDTTKRNTSTKPLPLPRATPQKRQVPPASSIQATTVEATPLEEFTRRWKEEFRVHSGEIKVLRALYRLTHGIGREDCVTTQDKLAEAAELRKRQCINNVNSLERMGFIERVEVYNEKGQRGIKLKLNLLPKQ